MQWEEIYVTVLLCVVFILLVIGFRTSETIFFGALVLLWNTGIISTKDAVSGFSNTSLLTVGVLSVVIKAVERSNIVDTICRKAFGDKTSFRMGLFRVQLVCFCMSAWFNNTPIVALLTPITRNWARRRGFAPSYFLIPVSYATIAGGLLTMIGTSTNLLVNGLLTAEGLEGFSFFQPGYVALPMGIVLLLYNTFLADTILPIAGGLFRAVRDRTDEMLTEIELLGNFPYLNTTVQELSDQLNIPRESIVKLRRRRLKDLVSRPVSRKGTLELEDEVFFETKIDAWGLSNDLDMLLHRQQSSTISRVQSVSFARRKESKDEFHSLLPPRNSQELEELESHELRPEPPAPRLLSSQSLGTAALYEDFFPIPENMEVKVGDILFISLEKSRLLELAGAGAKQGINILDTDVFSLSGIGNEYFELVVSNQNPFLGARFNPRSFMEHYNCSIIGFRGRNEGSMLNLFGIKNCELKQGDVLLVLAKENFLSQYEKSPDFFLVTSIGNYTKPTTWFDFIPAVLFVAMLVIVATGVVDILQASMSAAAFFVIVGWVDSKKAADYVDWRLLLLIGSALGVSLSITNSGLAQSVANTIENSNMGPNGALWLIYTFTMIITEVVANNAAAAIGIPIALSVASTLGVSYKPFALGVMYAASMSLATPIGYQTNTMVWGPGGYTFGDFARMGIPISLLNIALACLLIPLFFPF